MLAASAVGFALVLLLVTPLGHSLYGRLVPHSAVRDAALSRMETRVVKRLGAAALPAHGKAALPVRLKIPRLGVDAAVEDVGLTSTGQMDATASPATVAWFKLGPRPGDKGSAVIAGHSGYKNGVPAAFDDLPSLRKGDLLFVQDAKGVLIPFVVRGSRTYERDADASDVFASHEGRHLNLVTCTGTWDAAAGTHAQRLVVFAEAVP